MGHFLIDGFDFGVDAERSSFATTGSTVTLKLVGDNAVIRNTIDSDDHPWNWLIQPPLLYVIGVPCQLDAKGDFEHDITEEELDDYDIALYAMEHCDVLPCRITKAGRTITVTGMVHNIRAEPLGFHGQFGV